MNPYPRLNFPEFEFKLRRCGTGYQIWDAIRKLWLMLTPEEWVRQHLIHYMTECRGVVPQQIAQEHPVSLSGMPQRADVVIYGSDGKIRAVVECKATSVKICEDTLIQVVRYNSELKAPYVILTNGLSHYCYAHDPITGQYLSYPDFPEID